MSSRWRSPRKNQGMRPNRYGNEDGDGERDTTDRTRAKPPSKSKFHPIGKKRTARKVVQPPLRKHSSDSSSESTGYQKESDSDSNDDLLTVIDISKKKQKMPSRINRGRSGERRCEDNDNDNEPIRNNRRRFENEMHEGNDSNGEYSKSIKRGVPTTESMRPARDVRRRMFVDEGLTKRMVYLESESNDGEEKEDEDSDDGRTVSENRKKDELIATLTKKIKDLERTVQDLRSVTRMDNHDKTEWTGEEMNFVKDINDFCKEKLYPKEKFLRKNWQLYLPNDRTSLCWVVMKNLSIPEGSNPMDMWNRVIVRAIREKYLSMRCNLTTKIKGIYMSMTISTAMLKLDKWKVMMY